MKTRLADLTLASPSACFDTAIICTPLYRPFFIVILLKYLAEKVLLLNTTQFRGGVAHPRATFSIGTG